MNISVDGGALCAYPDRQFGNYTFSNNLLAALATYDSTNRYKIYTFCDTKLSSVANNFEIKKISPSTGFMTYRIPLEEIRTQSDVFLSLNQAIPSYTNGKIIAFSHGLAFHYYPELYPDSYKTLNHQLETMIKRADVIVVSSSKVRQEFNTIFPEFRNIEVIPFGISSNDPDASVAKKEPIFLYVGMDHPIKQIDEMIRVFLEAKSKTDSSNWKLVLVGVSARYEMIDKSIKVIPFADHAELHQLYQKASYLITASLYESFNFPVLEALSHGTPVIGLQTAIIPEFSDYVSTACDWDELENLIGKGMKGVILKKKEFNNDLSWQAYVKKLLRLYI